MASAEIDDDLFFRAPPEETQEIASAENGGEISQPKANETIRKTMERLVFTKQRKPRVAEKQTLIPVDDSSKVEYVPSLLRKLNSEFTFDDVQLSLPYWKTLAYLCSIDDEESHTASLAFVQRGGISVALQNLHDFIVRGDECRSDADFEAANEILRCLVAVTSFQPLANFDIASTADIVGFFIDLSSWTSDFGSKFLFLLIFCF